MIRLRFLPPRGVEGPITGGRVQIAQAFYMPPIRKLVGIVNAGNLPVPVEIEEHTIDGKPAEPRVVPAVDTPVQSTGADKRVLAKAKYRIGRAHERLGNFQKALQMYDAILEQRLEK